MILRRLISLTEIKFSIKELKKAEIKVINKILRRFLILPNHPLTSRIRISNLARVVSEYQAEKECQAVNECQEENECQVEKVRASLSSTPRQSTN